MKKEEKLKLVFDFIADYLSEGVCDLNIMETNNKDENVVLEQPTNDSLKRAYTIIKKLDDRDSETLKRLNKIDKDKSNLEAKTFNSKKNLSTEEIDDEWNRQLKSQTNFGITLDDSGNMVKVPVPEPLTKVGDCNNSRMNHNKKPGPDSEQLTHNID